MAHVLDNSGDVRIHLRGRRGLERIVRDEVLAGGRFDACECRAGLVAVRPRAAFSLDDVYALRCFGTAGIVLGAVPPSCEPIAQLVASARSREILTTFTGGVVRYRIDFVGKGHQRGAVRELANRIYALCPEILNDPRAALWSLDIHSGAGEGFVELRPRLSPDPRFAYRQADIPAASHPPLAACMARLATVVPAQLVWDPFCGSAVELIECALGGRVQRVLGTDLHAGALDAARRNFGAAGLDAAMAAFECGDFRDRSPARGTVDAIVTNPPLGMRVPVRDLRGLIGDLFKVAATALRPGGRLVLVNPLRSGGAVPGLRLESRVPVDMSGFEALLETYVKHEGRERGKV